MAPTKSKLAKAASSACPSDEDSQQQPSQDVLQIEGDTLAQIARMQNAKACSQDGPIAKQKSQGEEKIRNARKKRMEKTQKKMNDCQRKHQEMSRGQLRPKVDRLRELLEKKRDLEAKQDEHFQQVTSAMTATVNQLNVAIRDRCAQLAGED